ncbi:glycosyltransferase [Nitrosomonas mobilis]|uniref:glycosyltransferase n=1 Tax=Nitrosomonas mobilis TaxID=51642 RepID=UPI000B26D33F|nr:glycosyltransferase [Nitrosomonas mobilis]HNO74071.1 glycosyltransferase [Nitrosomonas mobilis]
MIYFAFIGLLLWWGIVLAPWRAWSTRESLVPLPNSTAQPPFGTVTVLIPARNEAETITQTLNALQAQNVNLRIIVIDDQSEDNTALIARQHGTTVISGTVPPVNWSGKLWALQQGLQATQTRYTLLLDADITLAPGALAALLLHARKNDLALVSLMATLPVERFVERLLIPAFIFFFKLLYPFSLANNPASRVAAAAGGCILVETEALRSVNAFESIHGTLIDDCTLAARIKHAGYKTWIGLSHGAYSHRGYDNLFQIWNMVARTAFTQLNYSLVLLLVCTLIMTSMFWLAPALAIICTDSACLLAWILSWMAMWIVFTPTLRFYQRSPLWAITLPLIGTLYLLMTWTSAFRYWRGERAQWKSRRYGVTKYD